MPRGGRRQRRTHQTGASNRGRIHSLADPVLVQNSPDTLAYADANTQIGTWKRPCKLLEAPEIVRTRLGGSIMRPVSRCSASRYSDVLENHVNEFQRENFVQPRAWSNDQPLLGVSEWEPGEAPRAAATFSVTDDVFVFGE